MTSRRFAYSSDRPCEGYISFPSNAGTSPCVLIAHSWAGEGEIERRKADELASLGYIAFAIDLFGQNLRGDHGRDNSDLTAPLLADRALVRTRMLDAVTAATRIAGVDPGRIAALGYFFGGLCVLDLARTGSPNVRGVVSMHGTFAPPQLGVQGKIRTKVLILHGWEDPLAPPEAVLELAHELTAASADWELNAYGGAKHAFSHPEAQSPERGVVYNKPAAERSLKRIESFLQDVFQ